MLTLILSRIYDARMNPGVAVLCPRQAKPRGPCCEAGCACHIVAGDG